MIIAMTRTDEPPEGDQMCLTVSLTCVHTRTPTNAYTLSPMHSHITVIMITGVTQIAI